MPDAEQVDFRFDVISKVIRADDETGGSLAIIITHHVAREQDVLRRRPGVLRAVGPGVRSRFASAAPEDVPIDTQELEASGRFDPPIVRRYEWDLEYSTSEFIDLISTYSANLVLEPEARSGLFDCTADLIDTRYGGRITKPYLNELQVARLSS